MAIPKETPLPKFDGKGSAIGYFKIFETLRPSGQYTDETRLQHLVAKLEGAAGAWLHGLEEEDWSDWSYAGLKQ